MRRHVEVLIASPPDRESVVAEIWVGNTQWGEMSTATDGHLALEVYSNPTAKYWQLDLEPIMEALAKARSALTP